MGKTVFFDRMRAGRLLGPSLSQSEVDGLNAILDAMAGSPLAYAAYALGTAYHETAHTMQPVDEGGGTAYFTRMYDPLPAGNRPWVATRLGNTKPGDGALFHGRGYVQLTGRGNYRKAGAILGVDLEGRPELAKVPANAARIMREGMGAGWFTGASFRHSLPDTGPATRDQFFGARRIINGRDRAEDIAEYALQFQAALS